MNRLQSVKTHRTVKLFQHSVKVSDNIVAAVPDVARVEADADVLRQLHAVDDGAQLLEAAADLAALAGHGLEQDGRGHVGEEDLIEQRGDLLNAHVDALPDVAAGVKIVELAGRVLHALQVVGKGHARKLRHVRLGCAGVECVGRVRDQPVDARAGAFGVKGRDVCFLNGFGAAAAGIAREERERVCAQRLRALCHGEIPAGGGNVAADPEHTITSKNGCPHHSTPRGGCQACHRAADGVCCLQIRFDGGGCDGVERLTFQPNKKGVISGCTMPVIVILGFFAYAMFPDGYKILTKGELVFVWVLVTVFVLGYAAALVYIMKSAGYRTMIEVSQQGFSVVDPKRSEPVFVPWSEQIHLCTCMEGDVYSHHWVHEKILCFSNQDISGQWIERGQTVNYRQTFETDAGQPWVVALTYGSKAKCKKDAARIRQYMDGCLQQTE